MFNHLRMINCNRLVVLFMALTTFLQLCHCIRFHLKPHSKKCLKHEMYTNQLAVGSYEVTPLPDTIVDISVTDSKGHIAFTRDKIEASAIAPAQLSPIEVLIDFRVGPEAKQYDAAEADKLSEVERDLNRIEDLTNAIIVDFAHLKKREKEMRDTNDSTNTRLFYQTVTSIIILLALTTWQVLYLRSFFRQRKLID